VPMIAITTKSSTSVNARRRRASFETMEIPPKEKKPKRKENDEKMNCLPGMGGKRWPE